MPTIFANNILFECVFVLLRLAASYLNLNFRLIMMVFFFLAISYIVCIYAAVDATAREQDGSCFLAIAGVFGVVRLISFLYLVLDTASSVPWRAPRILDDANRFVFNRIFFSIIYVRGCIPMLSTQAEQICYEIRQNDFGIYK